MEYKRLRPAQIILDPENPRLPDGTSSDKEAINRLIDDDYKQLLALARDLVEQGEANPSELPIVIKDGGKYLVLEGNRRFAALKLVADPKLADDPSHQAAFSRIKGKGHPPTQVFCAIAKDRDQAEHWIMLRHTGANDGIGTKRWNTEETARHRARRNATIDAGTLRSITIADELTEAYQVDEDMVAVIQGVRNSRLTNIGRLFSPDVLTRVRLEIRQVSQAAGRTLWAHHTAEDLHPFFAWAFEHLDSHPVDTFKNDKIRAELLNKNIDVMPNPDDAFDPARRLADQPFAPQGGESDNTEGHHSESDGGSGNGHGSSNGNSNNTGSEPGNSSAGNGHSDKGSDNPSGNQGRKQDVRPERFLYSTVRLPNLPPTVQRLLKEAKALPVEENFATACVLARVILELVVSSPDVVAWSKPKDDLLKTKIRACMLKLDPQMDNPSKRTRKDLEQAFLEIDTIGVRYMHQFLHNPAVRPDAGIARRFSAAYSPLLIAIDNEVSASK